MQANNHLFVAATEPVKVSLLWLLRLLRLRLLKVLPRSCHSTLRFLAEKRCKDRNAESCCNQKNRSKSNQKLISYHVSIYIYTVYMYYLSKFYLLIHSFIYALPSVPSCHGPVFNGTSLAVVPAAPPPRLAQEDWLLAKGFSKKC